MTTTNQIDDLIQEVQNQINESKPKEQTISELIQDIQNQLDKSKANEIGNHIKEQEDDDISMHIEKERKFIKALEKQIQKSLKLIWDLEKIKMEKELRKQIEEELENVTPPSTKRY